MATLLTIKLLEKTMENRAIEIPPNTAIKIPNLLFTQSCLLISGIMISKGIMAAKILDTAATTPASVCLEAMVMKKIAMV